MVAHLNGRTAKDVADKATNGLTNVGHGQLLFQSGLLQQVCHQLDFQL